MLACREFDLDDLDFCLEMGRLYTEEIGIELCEESFLDQLEKMYVNGKLFIATSDDEPVGVICLIPIRNALSGKKHLLRTDLFVHPDHRSKGIATLLNKEAKLYGASIGIEEYSWDLPTYS